MYNSLTFHLQAFVLKYQLNFSNKSRKHPCWIQHISNSVYTCIQDKGTLSQEIWRNCWGVNNGRSLAFCAELRFSVQQKSKTRAEILSSTEIHNQSWDSQYHRNTHLELIFSVPQKSTARAEIHSSTIKNTFRADILSSTEIHSQSWDSQFHRYPKH